MEFFNKKQLNPYCFLIKIRKTKLKPCIRLFSHSDLFGNIGYITLENKKDTSGCNFLYRNMALSVSMAIFLHMYTCLSFSDAEPDRFHFNFFLI